MKLKEEGRDSMKLVKMRVVQISMTKQIHSTVVSNYLQKM